MLLCRDSKKLYAPLVTKILILHTTWMEKRCGRYNQIKMPESQAIKPASRDKWSNQALILTVKLLDCHCRWECRVHTCSGGYPLKFKVYACTHKWAYHLSGILSIINPSDGKLQQLLKLPNIQRFIPKVYFFSVGPRGGGSSQLYTSYPLQNFYAVHTCMYVLQQPTSIILLGVHWSAGMHISGRATTYIFVYIRRGK